MGIKQSSCYINRAKWIITTVAFCFAILQALQPFIHAHLDGEDHSHTHGLHVAEDHESAHALEHLSNHSFSDVSHAAHTVSVSQGIKPKSPDIFNGSFTFVLIVIWFALTILKTPSHFLHLISNPARSFMRRLPAPRAPPYF